MKNNFTMLIEEKLNQYRKIEHQFHKNKFLCRDKLNSFKIKLYTTFFMIFLLFFIYYFPNESPIKNPTNLLWKLAFSLILTFVLLHIFRNSINNRIIKKYSDFGLRLDYFELKRTLNKQLLEDEQHLFKYLNYIVGNSVEFNKNNALARNESAIQSVEKTEEVFIRYIKIFKEFNPYEAKKIAKDIKKVWENRPIYTENKNIVQLLSNYHLLSTFINDEKATEINEFQKIMSENSYHITKEFPDIPEGYIDFSTKRDFEITARKKTLIDLLEE